MTVEYAAVDDVLFSSSVGSFPLYFVFDVKYVFLPTLPMVSTT